jgi:hypothetical protein
MSSSSVVHIARVVFYFFFAKHIAMVVVSIAYTSMLSAE